MSTNTPQPQRNEEVDLGQLFRLIGNMFDRFFKFIGRIFNAIFLAFVWMVFFVKKHIVKLLITGAIGFGLGIFKEIKSPPSYKSSVIVKQNYNTGENLYNAITYYNGLVGENDIETLAQILSVDTTDIASIGSFSINIAIGDNQRLVEYNDYIEDLDSSLVSKLEYQDYLENVENYIYDLQEITIQSKTNENYGKVFDGIINNISSNSHFKREQEKDLKELENKTQAIKQALAQSDSLQKTYKKVLESVVDKEKGSQTNITIEGSEDRKSTKEFDLYKNDIQLRAELVRIEREKQDKQFIIEIISNTENKGVIDTAMKVLNKSLSPKLFFAFTLPMALLILLLVLRFVKYLEKFQNRI